MHYSPDSSLTAAQHHVLSLLVQGISITAAADSAGIHRNTVANWRRTCPAFAREFEFAARDRAFYWHDQAVGLAQEAWDNLHSLMHDKTAPHSVRLRASLKILELAAQPKPEAMEPFPASAAQLEAIDGRLLAMHAEIDAQPAQFAQSQPQDDPQSFTTQPIRRTPQPGRNSPCPCPSGLKYKRCCANKPTPSATAPPEEEVS